MTKTILALTVLTSICFAGATFAGEELWFEAKGALPSRDAIEKCHCLADETNHRVVMAYGEVGLETDIFCFIPGSRRIGIQSLSALLMQWLPPEVVLPAIEFAEAFRFGEPGNFVPPSIKVERQTEIEVPF